MEFSTTQRGNTVLTYLGYEYLKFRISNGIVTWRCRQNQQERCSVQMKTTFDTSVIVSPPSGHCHEPIQKSKAHTQRKQNELTGDSPTSVKSSAKKNSMRDFENQFVVPQKYMHLILYDSGQNDSNRILAIGDKTLLYNLHQDIIYGDGSFNKFPNIFYQIYTWHAKINTSCPPSVYFLIQKKTPEMYNRMFQILKTLLPNMSPKKVIIDFEKTCMTAARNAFQQAEIKNCYFHLCRNFIGKINEIGLNTEYDSNIEVRLKLQSLCSLAFVPINEVRIGFDMLAENFPNEDKYNNMLSYFYTTYIEGPLGREPQFPIRIWNHFEAPTCTTNYWENFHNTLNSNFNDKQPCIWSLFDGLEKDIDRNRLILVKIESGSDIKRRKNAIAIFQEAFVSTVQKYNNNGDPEYKIKYLKRIASLQSHLSSYYVPTEISEGSNNSASLEPEEKMLEDLEIPIPTEIATEIPSETCPDPLFIKLEPLPDLQITDVHKPSPLSDLEISNSPLSTPTPTTQPPTPPPQVQPPIPTPQIQPLIPTPGTSKSVSPEPEPEIEVNKKEVIPKKRKARETDLAALIAAVKAPVKIQHQDSWEVKEEVKMFCKFLGTRLDKLPDEVRQKLENDIMGKLFQIENSL